MKALLQRTPLALKAVALGLIISMLLGGVLNQWQEAQLRHAVMRQLQEELSLHAEHDRQRFDEAVQGLRQVARLLAERPAVAEQLSRPGQLVNFASRPPNHRPSWLPGASTLRAIFHARYALLLNADGLVLDIYQHIPSDRPGLPQELRAPGEQLRMLSHSQSYMTLLDDTPYVLAAESIVANGREYGTLMVASPLDSEFLIAASRLRNGITTTALIEPKSGRIIASGDPLTIPQGSQLEDLKGDFLMLGKSFFDYGASDLELQFTSFIATDRAEQMSSELLELNAHQRSLLLLSLIGAFTLLILWYARRIYRLRRQVLALGDRLVLGLDENHRSGDEIYALERQFRQLADAVQASQQRLREEAKEEREQFALFPAKNPNPVLRVDTHGTLLYANDASAALGLEVGGSVPHEWRKKLQQSLEGDTTAPLEVAVDGRCFSFIPALLEGCDFISLYGMDVTERKRAEEEMRLAEAITHHVLDGIMVTETDGTIRSVNDAFCRMIGLPREELIGSSPAMFRSHRHGPDFYDAMWERLSQQGSWEGEIWNRRSDGQLLPCYSRISAIREPGGRVVSYVAVYSDISEHKATEERLTRMAFHDALTGLPNRLLFQDRLQHALSLSNRHTHKLAVMFVDLDGFKSINDNHGHEAGDQLLQKVAERLLACVRDSDTVSRLGGDEFAVILQDAGEAASLEPLAKKVLQAMQRPFNLEGGEDDEGQLTGQVQACISASIGIAIHPRDGDDAEQLLRSADQAMYEAKRGGKNAYRSAGGHR